MMMSAYIVVFTALTFFMSAKTNESVEEINKVYMSEINVQLQQKFTSIIDLRLSQVKGVIRKIIYFLTIHLRISFTRLFLSE